MIVKVSGEALSGPEGFGIHQPTIDRIANDLVAARALGVTLGVVVGGGNILRGVEDVGQEPVAADRRCHGHAGDRDERAGARGRDRARSARRRAPCRRSSMPQVCETYERQRALRHLEDNRIVVFAGGTGNPFFTTDTTAVLRAAEMDCDAVLKATNVDGVYSADPKKDPKAKRYDRI